MHLEAGRGSIGASTISQRITKNMLLDSNHVSPSRKIREALLAMQMLQVLSKQRGAAGADLAIRPGGGHAGAHGSLTRGAAHCGRSDCGAHAPNHSGVTYLKLIRWTGGWNVGSRYESISARKRCIVCDRDA
jgi:Transglycosylase